MIQTTKIQDLSTEQLKQLIDDSVYQFTPNLKKPLTKNDCKFGSIYWQILDEYEKRTN